MCISVRVRPWTCFRSKVTVLPCLYKSYGVVTTTTWPAANRYAARVCAQEQRTKKILNFGEVCPDLVTHYEKLNKVRSQKTVIFPGGFNES
ncbi:AGO2A2, putative [Medicago truncatula]|uniref:AGO2A2, putative n=1 Tax=Medicago truncatula TaxID=3880 RepID=G7IZD3_MEDTR|nr:AGO2A2, putative [Medicago truncatula]